MSTTSEAIFSYPLFATYSDYARNASYDFLLTFYSRLTMTLSRVVSEIFNVEKCRDLEIGVRGHSRSS